MQLVRLTQFCLNLSQRFIGNNKGNVSIIFGVTMVPILALSVGLLQQNQAVIVKRGMCNAVDASALLAAANPDKSLSHLEGKGQELFDKNIVKQGRSINIAQRRLSYAEETDSFTFSANGTMDTPLYSLLGIDQMDISCRATAKPRRNGLEIVVALDTTGSMGFGSSWANATQAMSQIIPSMQAVATEDEFFITFFPFSDRVNIGKSQDKWDDWLGSKAIFQHEDLPYGQWNGCVQPRPPGCSWQRLDP